MEKKKHLVLFFSFFTGFISLEDERHFQIKLILCSFINSFLSEGMIHGLSSCISLTLGVQGVEYWSP